MPEQLWFTAFLNHHLAGPVAALLTFFRVPPAFPQAPITNTVAMELLVFGILIALFTFIRMKLSVENPGTVQHLAEVLEEFVDEQSHQIIGHDNKRYVPFVMSLGYFILTANLIGLVPGFESPTANVVVPLGCAVCTFLYYHFHGLRHHHHLYIKQFLGPVWYLAPLMFLIEVISHFARILSLTVRLYANIFAGDLVTLAFLSLVPFLVPVAFMGLHIFVALVQTFIFIVLAMVYLGGAVSEEH